MSASRAATIPPQRLQELLSFLRGLGLDPTGAGGPGATAEGLAPIEEALSHSSARLARNHERLEFLGDAVLRLAASEFLRDHHPTLGVGMGSLLRAQLVSDRWLAELAAQSGIAEHLHLGRMAAGDRAGHATVLAESCEALIGALYLSWGAADGGLRPVLQWLTPHWQHTAASLLADPEQHNWKSALQEWSQARGLGLPHYAIEERNQRHGDPQRFRARALLAGKTRGEGDGPSRRQAEQLAARQALATLRSAADATAPETGRAPLRPPPEPPTAG